ncbi:MAG: CHRD domain-containing protein [Phycisphaeraceae bacterium]|nr:CHRD domain-containing protein [Phycisphaerales bacterium]MCB9860983.1 CHRD domain-containing protein [Phycisphaeraceae bacterium]
MSPRALISTLAVAVLAGTASADLIAFNFGMSGAQEVPANNSPAFGAGQLLYDTTTMTFDLDVHVYGIDLGNVTASHLHSAPAGVSGPVAIGLTPMQGAWVNDGLGIRLVLDDISIGAFQADLFAGNLYINLHTAAFPGGEIRGQLPAVPAPGTLTLAGAGLLAATRRRR